MIYDRSTYHLEALPRKADRSAAFVHIAMFFTWIVARGLHAKSLEQDDALAEPLELLKQRGILPTEFLVVADENLTDEMMSDEGNQFCRHSYEAYVHAFQRLFSVGSIYQVEETWQNYDRVAALLDARYAEWVGLGRPPTPYTTDGPFMRFLRRFI